MLTKIFAALLIASAVLSGVFAAYALSWLSSIGQPSEALAGYEYHAAHGWTILWLATAALLLIANAILWINGKTWAMWATFAYFAVSIIVAFFILDQQRFDFASSNGLTDARYSLNQFAAVLLLIMGAVIVFFDQFILKQMRAKSRVGDQDDELNHEESKNA